MSYERCVCAAGKGAGKQGRNGAGTWYRGKGADECTSVKRGEGGKKGCMQGSKGRKSDCYGDKDEASNGSKGNGKGKIGTRYYDCGGQGHIEVNCPHKSTNSMDEVDESCESDFEGEKPEELATWRHLTVRWNGVGPNGTESLDGEKESRCLEG